MKGKGITVQAGKNIYTDDKVSSLVCALKAANTERARVIDKLIEDGCNCREELCKLQAEYAILKENNSFLERRFIKCQKD